MAFPQYATAVTVDFITNLNLGTDWIKLAGNGTWANGATRFQSLAADGTEEITADTLTTLNGALKEATVVLPSVSVNPTWTGVGFCTTGSVGTSFNGYGFFVHAGDGRLSLDKYAAGVDSGLTSAIAGTFIPVAGDALGISWDGTTLTGYTRHSGVWTTRLTTTPSSPYSGNMYAWLDVTLANELDDLSLGSGVGTSTAYTLTSSAGSYAQAGTDVSFRIGATTYLRYRK